MRIGMLGVAQRKDLDAAIPPELARIMAPGTVLTTHPIRIPGFPYAPADLPFQQLGYLEAGIAAAPSCDALLYNTVGDYGLPALKSAVTIPVIGAGEASLRLAPSLGRRFAIVTIWPASMNFIPLGLLREYGLEAACTGIRNVGIEAELDTIGQADGTIARMQAGADTILDRIVAACHHAIAHDGAEVVVLGCTCMSPIAGRVAARCAFPVINPLAAGLKQAEAMAVLRLPASRVGQAPHDSRAAARAERARLMADAVAPIPQEPCPVCIAAAAE